MKLTKMSFMGLIALLLSSSAAVAGDFDWLKDINIKAEADPSGFKATLATRFKIGDVQINTVLSNVENPADAYMVLRLGEMSAQPTNTVIEKYKTGKGGGWGALAKSLGIKPGSREFHALKNGQDIYDGEDNDKGRGHGNSKGHGKGKH